MAEPVVLFSGMMSEEMSSATVLQTQISAIMEVLARAAAAEISQLLQEELRRRNEEIQELKTRLMITESRLRRATAERSSPGGPEESTHTALVVSGEEPRVAQATEAGSTVLKWEEPEEKKEEPLICKATETVSTALKREEEEELSGLELRMKIEQVEQLVDQKHDGDAHLWCSGGEFEDQTSPSLEHSQSFPDLNAVMMEEPLTQSSSTLFASGIIPENTMDYDLPERDSHRFCPPGSSAPALDSSRSRAEDPWRLRAGPKPFRCEECGTGFTQRTRLLTHRRIHTGEKPFRCQLCGKTFSRQDNCLRHVRLHSAQRQDNCLRLMRLHRLVRLHKAQRW